MIKVDDKNFSIDLKKFSEKVDEDLNTLFNKIVFILFRNIIAYTPVKTGRARANWNIGIGTEDLSTVEFSGGDNADSAALNFAFNKASKDFEIGEVIYLTNNLAYIKPLEEGWSDQAPNGMIARAMEDVANAIEEVSR